MCAQVQYPGSILFSLVRRSKSAEYAMWGIHAAWSPNARFTWRSPLRRLAVGEMRLWQKIDSDAIVYMAVSFAVAQFANDGVAKNRPRRPVRATADKDTEMSL